MHTNTSSAIALLELQSLSLSDSHVYPAFLFGTLLYVVIMSCNLLVLTTIAWCKKLHQPMFILLFSLPISDMLGATAFFPQFVMSIVTRSRLISYPACITQAFLIHLYGTLNLLSLSAMAYDRYLAICFPLRYSTLMSSHILVKIIVVVWLSSFAILILLFALLVRFRVCRRNLVDLFCNNPSLLKLVCDDTRLNDYYGLIFIVIIQGGPALVMLFTYMQILRTCLVAQQSDSRRKAIQTCCSHLIIYLILQINTFITLISHRNESFPPNLRRAFGVSVLLFPPLFDPIIYGLSTRELKKGIKMFLRRHLICVRV
ncbi:olfactory receptor 1M1-like [Nelusetta ayraudi]|uniref:olfactory receptor 1M1-like n=1 Tax=Nelusetta ayraudi TaxID=303726 RepID=UPI003F7268F7